MNAHPSSRSAALVIGARRACVACRTRRSAERCARCGAATIDLGDARGERTLALLCDSRPVPVRPDPTRDRGSLLVQVVVWSLPLAAAFFCARWSKKIDTHGFIDKKVLAALAALGGFLAGRVAGSIALAVAQLAFHGLAALGWIASSASLALVALGNRPRANIPSSPPGWLHGALRSFRTRARNAMLVPYGAPRETPRREPLGPVLEPVAPAFDRNEEAPSRAVEGTLLADGLVSIGSWRGSIVAVEGRTHGSDVADAALAPFRLRTDDGDELFVRATAGVVRFVDRPVAFEVVAHLPAAWGVRSIHAEPHPVNVWIAAEGSRIRVEEGMSDADGTWIGIDDAPLVITVLAAVTESPHETIDVVPAHAPIDAEPDAGTIAP